MPRAATRSHRYTGHDDPVQGALSSALASGLIPAGRPLLIAVSGGTDSVAMLHALSRLAHPDLGKLVVAHVDHGLREESSHDARAVGDLAGALGLPFVCARVEVDGRGGLQASARRARYEALEKQRIEAKADCILTAHTADDQAETIVLRLARGTSITGLSGIRPRSGVLVRPLLDVPRSELVSYCTRYDLPVREDPANSDAKFRRVRARHEILPLMELRLGPGVRDSLCRLARIASAETEVLDELARRMEREADRRPYGLDAGVLSRGQDAIVRRVLARLWLDAMMRPGSRPGMTPPPLESEHLDRMLSMLRRGRAGRMDLPGRCAAALSCERFVIHKLPWPRLEPLRIGGPGIYDLGRSGLLLEARACSRPPSDHAPDRLTISWPARDEVWVRGWRRGDRLVGGVKVSEVLRQGRVPTPLRPLAPVLSAGGHLLWVLGLRCGPPAERGPCLELVCRAREGTA